MYDDASPFLDRDVTRGALLVVLLLGYYLGVLITNTLNKPKND